MGKKINEITKKWVNKHGIPEIMANALALYLFKGIHPGGFLLAVLSNDLVGAIQRADDINIKLLKEYATILYWDFPMVAWGSKEKMEKWMENEGLKGLQDGEYED